MRLRTGSAWALASVGVILASGFLRTIIGARHLTPAEIGLMGIALLAVGFIEAVVSSGIDTALVAAREDVESYFDTAFAVQIARGVAIFGLLWTAAPTIAWFFEAAAATNVIRAVALVAPIRGLANPAVALAVRRLDFKRMFWWSLPEAACALGLTAALLIIRRDVWALVIATVAGQAVGTLASYGLVPRKPRLAFDRQRLRELLRFGRAVSGSRALMYVSANLDTAVVGVAAGAHTLGLYQFAARIAELPVVTFTRAAAQVALPTFSRQHDHTGDRRRTWRRLLGAVVAVNAASALVILVLGEAAVGAIAGARWLPALAVMQVLALAMPFRAVIVLTSQLLDARAKPTWTVRLNAVRLAALVVVLPLFSVWGGVRGVAFGVLIVNAGIATLALHTSSRALAAEPAT